MQVVKLAMDSDVELKTLTEAVASDPALSLRVLALVNSAAFMLSRKVSNVHQAIALLGTNGLRNLALSLTVSEMAPKGEEGALLLANSLRRALAAREIGRALCVEHPDDCFTAGLFLEIGLLTQATTDLAWVASLAQRPAAHRVVIERAAGRCPHPLIGMRLAREYSLPEQTVDAISHHHDSVPPEQLMARVCWLAERFAGVFEGGDLVATKRDSVTAAASIGMPAEMAERILEQLPSAVAESAAGMDRDVGEQLDLETLVEDANRSLVALNQHYELLVRQLQQVVEEKEVLEEQLRAANKRLAQEASTDALTGLPNKRAFEDALRRDLARSARSGHPLSLLVIDVDHFKSFNDTYGHAMGDEVLRSVGRLLLELMRTGDFPARYGGEEFVVLLPNTNRETAAIPAERIRAALERMPVPGLADRTVTASIGVATVQGSDCESRAEHLFKSADAALYAAKEGGRNRVCCAPPSPMLCTG